MYASFASLVMCHVSIIRMILNKIGLHSVLLPLPVTSKYIYEGDYYALCMLQKPELFPLRKEYYNVLLLNILWIAFNWLRVG